MEQAHASSLVQYDSAKLRVSHYEKLVGLCAGTLALSFTAATAFHTQHAREVGAFPGLLQAWQLLLGAIVLGVVSNWLTVNALANLSNTLGVQQIDLHLDLLRQRLGQKLSDYPKDYQDKWNRESTKASRWEKTANIMIRLAEVLGVLSQLAAFLAFVALYYFAKTVLLG